MVEELIVTLLPMEVFIFSGIQGLITMVTRAFHLFLSCVKWIQWIWREWLHT